MSYAQQSSGSGSASGPSSHEQLSSTYAATTAEPGPYTAPSSLNVASSSKAGQGHKTSSMTKRQQAAHRARILALSKQLATRLQYGMFKVEHGWSNQTHSEVENLYYRHKRSISSGPSPAPARKLSGPGSSSTAAAPPKTPLAPNRPSFSAGGPAGAGAGSLGAVTSAASMAKKPAEPVAADVFGGLMTPPASNGTLPSSRHNDYRAANKMSPVESSANAPRINGSSTYDDFWSKIGSSAVGSGSGRLNKE